MLFFAFHLAASGIIMSIFFPLLFLFTIWMVFLSLVVTFYYYNTAPIIKLDEEMIRFGRKKFNWKDLEEIDFSATKKWLFIVPVDCTSFTFKDGTKMFMNDHFYSNSSQVKLYLDQVIIKKQDYSEYSHNNSQNYVSETVLQSELFTTFEPDETGPFIFFKFGLIGIFLMLIFNRNFSPERLIGAAFVLYLISLFFRKIYFLLSPNFLIVKMKYNPFWKKAVFYLKDVSEVNFEKIGGNPYIKIFTKNLENRRFSADNFSNDKLLELKRQLTACNVPVKFNIY